MARIEGSPQVISEKQIHFKRVRQAIWKVSHGIDMFLHEPVPYSKYYTREMEEDLRERTKSIIDPSEQMQLEEPPTTPQV